MGQCDTVPQGVAVGDRDNEGDPENEPLTVAQDVPLRKLVGEPEGEAQEDPVGKSVGESVPVVQGEDEGVKVPLPELL